MASILDRYGIKEVADVTFYEINDDGSRGKPVLFLDTLKVSTIEQTASTADARGGKGNPVLVSWDFGKEINLNIEDALFSPKSMAVMFGDGSIASSTASTVEKTASSIVTTADTLPTSIEIEVYSANGPVKKNVSLSAPSDGVKFISVFDEGGVEVATIDSTTGAATVKSGVTFAAGSKLLLTYSVKVDKKVISIDGNTFPGTYYVTGDTYARSDVTGKDQFFQFIIKKAKMQAENTITLQAEGDPSVFNMSLKVLRPASGDMMELVQYDLANPQ